MEKTLLILSDNKIEQSNPFYLNRILSKNMK